MSDPEAQALHPLVGGFRDAGNYDRGRPRYGAAVATALIEALGLHPGAPVLELGAGTGQLSEALLASGLELTAVEPLGDTRALLAGRIGAERVRDGTAEAIPLPDASVDAVLAADAFHWFDQDRAMPEIHRVLRRGGGVAILRTLPRWEGPWSHELGRLVAATRPEHPAFNGQGAAMALGARAEYGPVQEITIVGEQETDPERMRSYIASFSWVGALDEPARAELLDSVAEVFRRHEVGAVRHPVDHHIWVARLR